MALYEVINTFGPEGLYPTFLFLARFRDQQEQTISLKTSNITVHRLSDGLSSIGASETKNFLRTTTE